MGNAPQVGSHSQEQEVLRTAGTLFVQSIENSFVTVQMVHDMLTRW